MFRQYFAGMEHTGLALFAMFLFLVLFALILLRTFVLRRRRDYDRLAALPLADDPHADSGSDSVSAAAVPHEVTR